MKILLLKLPYGRHPKSEASDNPRTQNSYRPLPSLALAALSAFLKTYGPADLEVEAVDLNLWAYRPEGVDSSRLPESLEHVLARDEYDVLGISGMFTHNVRWLDDAVMLSNLHHPEARIIVGGAIAGMGFGEGTVTWSCGEIKGEGEIQLLKNLTGVLYDRSLGVIDLAGNLEALPPPDWEALGVRRHFLGGGNCTLPIEASRGCPYDCSYCTVTGTWGAGVRYKSVSQVMREIVVDVVRHGAKKLHFVDDNLAFNRRWFREFLDTFKRSGIPVQLDASNFSIKHLDNELAEMMVACGFRRISVAIESGSEGIQESTGKRLKLYEVPTQVAMLKAAGLRIHLCWMLGFPGETIGQIETTLDFAKQLGAASNQFLTVTPYPGTRLWKEAGAAGMLVDDFSLDSLDCRGARLLKNQEWDYDWLEERIYDANIDMNFLENPLLREAPLEFEEHLEGVVRNHPGHVIALILLGWLKQGCRHGAEVSPWCEAAKLLRNPEIAKTFQKYLGSKHPAIEAFKREVENVTR